MRAGPAKTSRSEAAGRDRARVRTMADAARSMQHALMRMDGALRDLEQSVANAAGRDTSMSATTSCSPGAGGRPACRRPRTRRHDHGGDPGSRGTAGVAQVTTDPRPARLIGNTRVGEEYIFAGASRASSRLLANGAFVRRSAVRQTGIAEATECRHQTTREFRRSPTRSTAGTRSARPSACHARAIKA